MYDRFLALLVTPNNTNNNYYYLQYDVPIPLFSTIAGVGASSESLFQYSIGSRSLLVG